jgi:hypothetical protein
VSSPPASSSFAKNGTVDVVAIIAARVSSGNQMDSGRKRCSATAGVIDEFVAEFVEPPIEHHGVGYVAPSVDAPRRYVFETRVRLHEVCRLRRDDRAPGAALATSW